MRRLGRNTCGEAYVEFLIVIFPFLTLILGLIQFALLYVGGMVVQRSANTAVRAAIVVLDDDPEEYDRADRNRVNYDGSGSSGSVAGFLELMGQSGGSGPSGRGGPRLQAIRAAASIPLMAISPAMSNMVGSGSVYQAIGGDAQESALVGAAVYNKAGMAVTFPSAPGSDSQRTSFGMRDNITVRVTYLYHCGVPLVRYLICESIPSLQSGTSIDGARAVMDADTDELAAAQERLGIRNKRIERWKPGMKEMDDAEIPGLMSLAAFSGSRFFVIRAEATLPNHGAPYGY